MSDFPKITFDISEISDDTVRSTQMFEGMRGWFAERGYTMYTFGDPNIAGSSFPTLDAETLATGPADLSQSPLPYAYVGGQGYKGYPTVGQLKVTRQVRIFFAQDEKGRHVAIKLVKKDSDEYKIAQILLEKGDAAGNHCVIPVLDIIDCEEHAFMVMPRWDEMGLTQWLRTLANVLDYVHCLLKGLAFLHEHCIIHRDLKVDNILCNHFGIHRWEHNWLRDELMKQRRLIFAISDFNMSLLLPPSSRPRCFRLPTCRSWESYVDRAYDVRQGELDYDPFLLDVGNLGVVFARYLRDCMPLAPILAPLIDNMVTDDLSRRFTAFEALQFFEATVDSVPRENLDVRVCFPRSTGGPYEDVVYLDRWVGLPPEFIVKWSAYRLQRPTLSLRLLRWFCDLDDRAFFAVQSARFLLRGHFKAAFLRAGHALTSNENWFRPEDEL